MAMATRSPFSTPRSLTSAWPIWPIISMTRGIAQRSSSKMMNSSVRAAARANSARMFGGVPANTLLVRPNTSVS